MPVVLAVDAREFAVGSVSYRMNPIEVAQCKPMESVG